MSMVADRGVAIAREISGNPAWRELVNRKYVGADIATIKADLNIPV